MTNGELSIIGDLLAAYTSPWAVCGGWAIDLFLGRVTRSHKDIDIAVLRRDQKILYSYLTERGWRLEVAHDGVLTPWHGESLELPLHTLWCRQDETGLFLEVLLNEADDTHFLFRRNREIKRIWERAFLGGENSLPFLAPEIVLLYKSSDLCPDNIADYRHVHPRLESEARDWFQSALRKTAPAHEWLGHAVTDDR